MQEANENLALILDHVGDGVTVQEPGGRLIYANAPAARALGFASAADLLATPLPDLLGRFALFDEEGRPLRVEDLPGRRVLAGEPEATATLRFHVHATGEEHWSFIRATGVTDASGRLRFVVNIWQDVTERYRDDAFQRFLAEAGEALAGSLDIEATLKTIALLAVPRLGDWCAVHLVREDQTIAQVAVAHVDPERVAWALELQQRYPADPDAGHGVYQVIRTGQPELMPEVTAEMLMASARDPEHLEMLRKVGITSALIAPMLVRGKALGAISFVTAESRRHYDERDLQLAQELAHRAALAVESARLYDAERTARSLAEAAQTRFRALFEGVPDAILVVDTEGRTLEANVAASLLFASSPDTLLRTRLADLTPDPEQAWVQFAVASEADEWRGESTMKREDGTLIPVEIWARRLDLPAGPISIAVIRDLTERQAAAEARDEVLAAISHDLRNPLGSIKLHAQALHRLVRRGAPVDPTRLEESLTAIDTMATRITFLLDDIVDVARAQGGEPAALALEPTDLVSLVGRCATEAGTGSGRAIQVEAPVTSLVGLWDPRAIERVVLNLLNNALKYSPQGGEVRVRVEPEDLHSLWARLTVSDQGIGIPSADLPTIFERYRRGRNVGGISGTGLGLTGVKQTVERHGGTIALESEEGRGTRVTVRLPLQPAEVGEPSAAR